MVALLGSAETRSLTACAGNMIKVRLMSVAEDSIIVQTIMYILVIDESKQISIQLKTIRH